MRYLVVLVDPKAPNPHVSPQDLEDGSEDSLVEIIAPVEFEHAYEVEWYLQTKVGPDLDWALFEKVNGSYKRMALQGARVV